MEIYLRTDLVKYGHFFDDEYIGLNWLMLSVLLFTTSGRINRRSRKTISRDSPTLDENCCRRPVIYLRFARRI